MRKLYVRVGACLLIAVFAWFGTLLSDRQRLKEELIRIHVVANSDSPRDQRLKLSVRDAVVKSIQKDLENVADITQAKSYLQDKLPYIQTIANQTLKSLGCKDSVSVTLQQEVFDQKSNAVLSLPAGVYESLRIIIGSGQGENWWSVVFPEACNLILEEEKDMETAAGFPDSLKKSLSKDTFEIRFYFLDVLGKVENIFFRG